MDVLSATSSAKRVCTGEAKNRGGRHEGRRGGPGACLEAIREVSARFRHHKPHGERPIRGVDLVVGTLRFFTSSRRRHRSTRCTCGRRPTHLKMHPHHQSTTTMKLQKESGRLDKDWWSWVLLSCRRCVDEGMGWMRGCTCMVKV